MSRTPLILGSRLKRFYVNIEHYAEAGAFRQVCQMSRRLAGVREMFIQMGEDLQARLQADYGN